MLSVCSPYFRRLLSENRHKEKHHIIHLHGVSPRHMQQLLLYMYRWAGFSNFMELYFDILKGGDLNPAGRSCSTHRNCPLSSSQRWHKRLSSEISKVFNYHQKYQKCLIIIRNIIMILQGYQWRHQRCRRDHQQQRQRREAFLQWSGQRRGRLRQVWNQEQFGIKNTWKLSRLQIKDEVGV